MTDGRSTRWESHRHARRAELVEATLVAIRRHGPLVGMDEVAAVAGTSKTVLYRHFADKSQLYLAVCARVADTLLGQLRSVLRPDADPRDTVAAGIDVYLHLIESDPQVYRFVVRHASLDRPLDADPVGGLIQLIGDQVARVIEPRLRTAGFDPAAALPWGHGLIGMVRAAADPWLDGRVSLSRADLTTNLTRLVWDGLCPVINTSIDHTASEAR
ncbi:TetR family transcriptional regulator [Pseudonocardia spinosispora]|uniref:TetR family transcriptional regulator n=1 Tax=Pseudonocardia spinosispora TaxID=103441 RepID=UPI00056077DF|nr:TetR family transcriptional regulator [Pseudonocardia spinosispora]